MASNTNQKKTRQLLVHAHNKPLDLCSPCQSIGTRFLWLMRARRCLSIPLPRFLPLQHRRTSSLGAFISNSLKENNIRELLAAARVYKNDPPLHPPSHKSAQFKWRRANWRAKDAFWRLMWGPPNHQGDKPQVFGFLHESQRHGAYDVNQAQTGFGYSRLRAADPSFRGQGFIRGSLLFPSKAVWLHASWRSFCLNRE